MKGIDYDIYSLMNFGSREYDIRKVEDSWVYTLHDTKKFLTIRFNIEQNNHGKAFRILHFRVNPRGHHIGSDFIQQLLVQLQQYNFHNVQLTAMNFKAYCFWTKMGFESKDNLHMYLHFE